MDRYTMASSTTTPTMTGPIPTYRKPWALPASARPEFDPKKARRLLTEAGYAGGFETELIVGSPGDNVKSAQVVKDQLAKVGIQVNLKPMEMAQYYNKSYSYDYSMSVHTALTGEEPEEAIRPYYGANATYYRWGNREIHRLIDEQAKILDLKKRVEMVHLIQRMLLDVVAVGSDIEWLPMSASGVSLVIDEVTISGV